MQTFLENPITDCYKYREVLANIVSQALKVKYRRTALGYVWSLLNPIINLAVFATVFSHLVRWGMKNYTQYLFSSLIAWTFFQQSLLGSAMSLLENESFIKKVYLPKILFPLSKVCLRAIDFTISMVALTFLGILFGFEPHATIAFVPVAMVLLGLFTIGLACIVAVLTVYFRDVEYLLAVFLQLLYFGTPILYPLSALPEHYHFWLKLNPLFTQIHLFQQLIYFGVVPSATEWLTALAVSVAVFVFGVTLLSAKDQDLVFRM